MTNKITKSFSRYPVVVKLPKNSSVSTAARLMAEHNVGAVIVMDNHNLVGIFTERDVVIRVVAKGLAADKTLLSDVMTPHPITLQSGTSLSKALELMDKNRVRHLPIEENGEVVGMVSSRDLLAAVNEDLKENIHTKDAMLFGEAYGATTKAAA